ncbi:MAG TPA: glycosyltransferase family 2 protein [Burkholderiaceae bacterium]|nr:glycosyltransferase family 2 protein [Burkholderiaceae bacterium]
MVAPTERGLVLGTGNQARGSLSVVVPVFNEQEVLGEFHRRLAAVLDALGMPAEIVYVNDGSSDRSLALMHELCAADARVSIIDLSRNFGKEIAMTAGIDLARGDGVVVIDADLQDPPEVIGELVAEWKAGHDVVYAQRAVRDGESFVKKLTAAWFYRLIQRTNRVRIPVDTGDFRLLSRRAVDSLKQLREHHRFMKGLFAWVGHSQKAVLYKRDARFAGESKFNYWRLWNFALEGFTSFTIAPLKSASYLGLAIAGLAFVYAIWIIFKTLAFGDPVAGYPSLMVVILFLGGVQLIGIGVLGEYVGRMFNETKGRPLYILNEHVRARTMDPPAAETDETFARPERDASREGANPAALESAADDSWRRQRVRS